MYVLYIVVCLFVLFHLSIVLSVLRFTDSDYPFGIFKLYFTFIYCSTVFVLRATVPHLMSIWSVHVRCIS